MRTSFPVDQQTRTQVIYIYHYTPQRSYESPHQQQCCPTVHTRMCVYLCTYVYVWKCAFVLQVCKCDRFNPLHTGGRRWREGHVKRQQHDEGKGGGKNATEKFTTSAKSTEKKKLYKYSIGSIVIPVVYTRKRFIEAIISPSLHSVYTLRANTCAHSLKHNHPYVFENDIYIYVYINICEGETTRSYLHGKASHCWTKK